MVITRFVFLSIIVAVYVSACSGGGPDCCVFPPEDESPHVLPYDVGAGFVVVQSTLGPTHPAPLAQYAYDFDMPVGTNINASRSGTVTNLVNIYPVNGGSSFGNFVCLTHDDGTTSRYAHLTENGVLVVEGESVVQGQIIGLSGNTGNSGGPHLHYEVANSCGPPRARKTIPVTFSNTSPHPDGLVVGEVYIAEPF